jgi:hypothetical protein
MKRIVVVTVEEEKISELTEMINNTLGNEVDAYLVTDAFLKDIIGYKITEDGQLPRSIENNLDMLIDVYKGIIYDNGGGLYEFEEKNGQEGKFDIRQTIDAVDYMINFLTEKRKYIETFSYKD